MKILILNVHLFFDKSYELVKKLIRDTRENWMRTEWGWKQERKAGTGGSHVLNTQMSPLWLPGEDYLDLVAEVISTSKLKALVPPDAQASKFFLTTVPSWRRISLSDSSHQVLQDELFKLYILMFYKLLVKFTFILMDILKYIIMLMISWKKSYYFFLN